ncbi:MAG: hypothetical protein K2Q45_06620 [Nitrosomonas sp.]|nr:hypothetical protein [Nitrosomonas sp.]
MKKFVFIKRLGKGEMSVIARLDSTDDIAQQIVVKIMPLDVNARQDLSIACQLNNLHNATPVFIQTWGWLACHEIPREWKQYMFALPTGVDWSLPVLIFQVMDYSPESWSDKNTTLLADEYEAMLFLLLHGLYVARKELGSFSHNDIHEGQVLLQPCKPNTEITCMVEGVSMIVQCKRFVPKLIDFGLASSKSLPFSTTSDEDDYSGSSDSDDDMFESSSTMTDSSDVKDLLTIFETRMRRDKIKPMVQRSDFMLDAQISDPSDYKAIANVLLKDARFKKVVQKATFVAEKAVGVNEKMCMVCASPAEYVWPKSRFYFCNARCANKWENIRPLIKL